MNFVIKRVLRNLKKLFWGGTFSGQKKNYTFETPRPTGIQLVHTPNAASKSLTTQELKLSEILRKKTKESNLIGIHFLTLNALNHVMRSGMFKKKSNETHNKQVSGTGDTLKSW